MINKGLFTSKTDQWSTPDDFFASINAEFNFTLDVCADESNRKCKRYFDRKRNGLAQNWDNERVWMNPPYGREIGLWVRKASEAVGGVVVCLLPARTDTKYFHEYIYNKKNAEIRFLKGRLKFGGSKNSAPFPSMLVIFRR